MMQQVQDCGFFKLAGSRPVVRRALKVALLVGTILALINHGDKLLEAGLSAEDSLKILLTYLVPFCVSTWSSVRAIQQHSVTATGTNQDDSQSN